MARRRYPPLKPVLPLLQTLICRAIGLQFLDLSKVPVLTQINCGGNDLTELHISLVPGLTHLRCDKATRLLHVPDNLSVKRL